MKVRVMLWDLKGGVFLNEESVGKEREDGKRKFDGEKWVS